MTESFEVGNLVELEPNGQTMRAVEIKDDDMVCQWISKSGTLQTAQFPKACVRKRPEIEASIQHQDIYSDWDELVKTQLSAS
jgi:uncharacterized protein YodC (DUF2158 family)